MNYYFVSRVTKLEKFLTELSHSFKLCLKHYLSNPFHQNDNKKDNSQLSQYSWTNEKMLVVVGCCNIKNTFIFPFMKEPDVKNKCSCARGIFQGLSHHIQQKKNLI